MSLLERPSGEASFRADAYFPLDKGEPASQIARPSAPTPQPPPPRASARSAAAAIAAGVDAEVAAASAHRRLVADAASGRGGGVSSTFFGRVTFPGASGVALYHRRAVSAVSLVEAKDALPCVAVTEAALEDLVRAARQGDGPLGFGWFGGEAIATTLLEDRDAAPAAPRRSSFILSGSLLGAAGMRRGGEDLKRGLLRMVPGVHSAYAILYRTFSAAAAADRAALERSRGSKAQFSADGRFSGGAQGGPGGPEDSDGAVAALASLPGRPADHRDAYLQASVATSGSLLGGAFHAPSALFAPRVRVESVRDLRGVRLAPDGREDAADRGPRTFEVCLRFWTLLPDATLRTVHLAPLPLLRTPLAAFLLASGAGAGAGEAGGAQDGPARGGRCGLLTMHTNRCLVPLLGGDASARTMPLLGLWVLLGEEDEAALLGAGGGGEALTSGLLRLPWVFAACLRYAAREGQGQRRFLLGVFGGVRGRAAAGAGADPLHGGFDVLEVEALGPDGDSWALESAGYRLFDFEQHLTVKERAARAAPAAETIVAVGRFRETADVESVAAMGRAGLARDRAGPGLARGAVRGAGAAASDAAPPSTSAPSSPAAPLPGPKPHPSDPPLPPAAAQAPESIAKLLVLQSQQLERMKARCERLERALEEGGAAPPPAAAAPAGPEEAPSYALDSVFVGDADEAESAALSLTYAGLASEHVAAARAVAAEARALVGSSGERRGDAPGRFDFSGAEEGALYLGEAGVALAEGGSWREDPDAEGSLRGWDEGRGAEGGAPPSWAEDAAAERLVPPSPVRLAGLEPPPARRSAGAEPPARILDPEPEGSGAGTPLAGTPREALSVEDLPRIRYDAAPLQLRPEGCDWDEDDYGAAERSEDGAALKAAAAEEEEEPSLPSAEAEGKGLGGAGAGLDLLKAALDEMGPTTRYASKAEAADPEGK